MQIARLLTGTSRTVTRHGEPVWFEEGLYQLADHTYAWMVPNGSWGETNIGLIDCNGQSVLIDTCWDIPFSREMLAAAADIVKASPIETVINTHADGDHCWGNQLFAGKEIIATHACIHQMHHLKPQSAIALRSGGRVLRYVPAAAIDKFGRYMSEMLGPYDFRDVRITDPSLGFSGEHSLNVNGTEIVIMEVGPGHTDGDAMVYLPQHKVVYAGDIAFIGVTPVMWSGPLENLVAALKKLLGLNAEVIVPGHGPLATRADIERILDYWHFVHEQIHLRFQRDMTPFEAARDLVLSPLFQSQVFARWDSPERMVTNAFTLYRQWGARLRNLPGPLGIMDILRQQAQLAFQLPTATPVCMHRF